MTESNNLRQNWGGNHTFQAADYFFPESISGLQSHIKNAEQVKVLGTRHSFNHIADTTATHISLSKLPRVFEMDAANRQVTVSADMAYGEFCEQLHQAGFALHNLASLPHISVAGACATATHGSGVSNGNLATVVAALEMVMANGDLIHLTRDDAWFAGAVVSLGALGIVTTMTLDVEPTYQMRQWVYEDMPMAGMDAYFEELMSRAYSVSLFTPWIDDVFTTVMLKERVVGGEPEAPAMLYGGQRVTPETPTPDPVRDAARTTHFGIPGAWHNRLPHFRMGHTPSHGEELQTEYYVPSAHAVAAIKAVYALRDRITPHIRRSEIRTIAADSLWMSPCYEQDCVSIHFTWKQDWPGVRSVLPLIEASLVPFEARPHWGKLFTMPAERVQSLYARLPDFQQLIQRYDPERKFRNDYLDSYIL